MNYIYDIVLNFNRDYFEFFQWKKGDKIIHVKKIPAFKVSDSDIMNFKYNNLKVSEDFLNKIFELTLFYNKSNDYKYLCLLSSGNETIGVMFNKDGYLIKRSSLVFDEEDEVNNEVINEENFKIDYLINEYNNVNLLPRIDKDRMEYLSKFISNLDVLEDSNILKYMYYDYFEKEEDNICKIKEIILSELNNNSCNKKKLYDLIKIFKKIRN